MIEFTAAPAIPSDYPWLRVLSAEEIQQARSAGYVAQSVDPGEPVKRAGFDWCFQPRPDDDMQDWRTRIYVVWFCYIYENFGVIKKPLSSIEELIFEFKAQEVIDPPNLRLASLYAGAGHLDPLCLKAPYRSSFRESPENHIRRQQPVRPKDRVQRHARSR